MINLDLLEISLKKRWQLPYNWNGSKQTDSKDYQTKFIYETRTYSELTNRIKNFEIAMQNYALNRWYNFWSAKGIEQIFANHTQIIPNKNQYDKLVDFTIEGIPFDHKSSVFPAGFKRSLAYAQENKQELIEWFYKNQSQEGRKHLKNRLFVVFYESTKQEHWKLKAEINWIKVAIDHYVERFSRENLLTFNFGKGDVHSDIIWLIK